ncbi:hypothetical protein FS837_009251 [Tulasnella sp. UAMH 9824]|nr:hypothetical protein FS837_009251 [Tulasnella sp. UAMH 9824]
MSTEQQIVENAVLAYLKLSTNQNLATDHDALEPKSEQDAIIDALEHIGNLFFKNAAKLRRTQNLEHSPLCNLPQELLVEILLLSIDWCWWNVEKLRTLASVSTIWRDTIISCNRFWSVMDIAAGEEARRITMKRNQGGAMDLWLWGTFSLSGLKSFMSDVGSIHRTRLRSVLYEHGWNTGEFMEYLQNESSNVIDLFLGDFRGNRMAASLDIASDGPNLRHVDTRGMGLPWHSPRFTNLHTISLTDFKYHIPQITDLYAILSSSPELERFCMINIGPSEDESLESPPAFVRPIHLPQLKTLAFSHVATGIGQGILPLIRASSCRTVVIDGDRDFVVALEPQEATTQLIAKAMVLSNFLEVGAGVEEDDGACIWIRSEPTIDNNWACWARDRPGVNVKLAVPSAEDIPRLWEYLGNALRIHGGATGIDSIEVEWAGQIIPFPFTLLEHCPALTSLRFNDNAGTTLYPLIQFLGRNGLKGSVINSESHFPLPKLGSLSLSGQMIPNLEACVSGTKELLERRYPALREGVVSGDAQVLKHLYLPSPLVDALQQGGVATSFNMEEIQAL